MIISHKYNFIYFANARTGTTSIEIALKPYHDGDDLIQELRKLREQDKSIVCPNIKHMRPATLRTIMKQNEWDRYYKFVFVRNPWDWVISQYLRHNPESFVARGRKKFSIIEFYGHWYRMRRYSGFYNDPSYLQHHFIQGVDNVGRYEKLENDFSYVCSVIGITPGDLPHTNNAPQRNDYKEYYDRTGKWLVSHYYKDDIEKLGYSF